MVAANVIKTARQVRTRFILGAILLGASSFDHYLYLGEDLALNARFIPGAAGAVFMILGALRLHRVLVTQPVPSGGDGVGEV